MDSSAGNSFLGKTQKVYNKHFKRILQIIGYFKIIAL